MRILGIDPGTGKLGYGIIDVEKGKMELVTYGCVTTPVGEEISKRLVIIFDNFKEILDKYKPDLLAVEKLFFARNVTTAMNVGEARGVVMLVGALNQVRVSEYTPLQVKQAITGYGRAEKGQIQRMVQHILKMEKPPRPDDAADALGIAICASSDLNNLGGACQNYVKIR